MRVHAYIDKHACMYTYTDICTEIMYVYTHYSKEVCMQSILFIIYLIYPYILLFTLHSLLHPFICLKMSLFNVYF